MRLPLILATAAATLIPMTAMAQDMSSICYSRGSETEGVTGVIHEIDGRAVRVDSPWANDSRTRVVEWLDEIYPTTLLNALTPVFDAIPTDLIAQCDEGWRDVIVIRFDDGSSLMREGSCLRNPVAQTLDAIFAEASSVVENEVETFTDGPLEGAYAPCFHEW